MKIIISPAKKMRIDPDTMAACGKPVFLAQTGRLLSWLKGLSAAELQRLWACNDRIASQNLERLSQMEPERALTPALLSYDGIQYQYMAPNIFSREQWDYVQSHLRILSGFYGLLRPLDPVEPYRLEMQAKGAPEGCDSLYAFWGDSICRELLRQEEGDPLILNLASKEYSRCVSAWLKPPARMITCVFGEEKDGKVIQKGTMAKMARGEMVRFLAERRATDLGEIRTFDRLGYRYAPEYSKDGEEVFLNSAGEHLQSCAPSQKAL
ncbi:MAG: peroxide stress protein YaaA [Eubacteriales bacterium]|nr:peroxide stress protein YaaA [Eubacteriales bacterium]